LIPKIGRFELISKALLFISLLVFLFSLSTPSYAGTENGVKYYKKGLALYGQGYYEEALERFQQALDENFEFWQAYQMVGYCYFEMRKKEDAMKAFEESLEINPNNPKLQKIYHNLKSGVLDIPLRPLAEATTRGLRAF
jgi:tetratricopeptide (TPR) repeat protein